MRKAWLMVFAAVGSFASGSMAAVAEVPPALQSARRHMLDANINALTFHNMDEIFDTRRVDNAGPVWNLPRAPAQMDLNYTYDGKTYSAQEALERTYTNALVVMKQGRIVAEVYRNKTDENT